MHRGQNWAYVNFSGCGPASSAADGPGDGSVVLHGEHNLQEALRLSLAPGPSQDPAPLQGEKRKAEQEQERPAAKKRKLNSKTEEEVEESNEVEQSDEDEESEDEEETESEEEAAGAALYALPLEPEEVKEFPTMLDLLEVDNEIVLDLLRERCQVRTGKVTGAVVQSALQVDEHLVVPKFDEFLHHSALLASSCRLIGCDGDGKVQIVDPAAFRRGDGAELGYIETTQVTNRLDFHKKANF